MRLGFYTLGCKVNQYETQAMEQLLRAMLPGSTVFTRRDGDGGAVQALYEGSTGTVAQVMTKYPSSLVNLRYGAGTQYAVVGVCGRLKARLFDKND